MTNALVKIRRATTTSAMLSRATRRRKTDAPLQRIPARPILELTSKICQPPLKPVVSFVAVSNSDLKFPHMKLPRERLWRDAASSLLRTKVTLSMASNSFRRVSHAPTASWRPFINTALGWANNIKFPPAKPAGVIPGFDPIIGQTTNMAPRMLSGTNPNSQGTELTINTQWVVPKGGEYFFSPSIPALKKTFALAGSSPKAEL